MRCQQLTASGAPLVSAKQSVPVPGGRDVVVEVDHCGVCHSDLHLQDGFFDLGHGKKLDVEGQRTLPLTLGHEIAGRVVALGADVPAEFGGRFVAVYPWIGCGDCRLCERGDEHLCDRPRALGINVDGGFATHVVIPDTRYLLDLTGVASRAAGCLMCSGLTAYSALKKARARRTTGELVIVGAGGVGLMALQFAAALGLESVDVVDVSEPARAAAVELGARAALDPTDPETGKALRGAGAVIDFVGSGQSLGFAQRVVAKGGSIVVVGLMGGRFCTPVPLLPFTSISIEGSYVGSLDEAREMLALVRKGAITEIPLNERPLAEAGNALDDLRAGSVVGRTVIRP